MKTGDTVKLVRYVDDPDITILASMGWSIPPLGAVGKVVALDKPAETPSYVIVEFIPGQAIGFRPSELQLCT